MKHSLKITVASVALVTTAASVIGASLTPEALMSSPVSQLNWHDVPGTNAAVRYANTEGDILSDGKGAYSAFVSFKGGTDNGLHRHSQALPTVVMAGTFYAVIEGRRTEYPAGSFYKLPANLVHESGCKAGQDCLLFQYQDNNFDLIPLKL